MNNASAFLLVEERDVFAEDCDFLWVDEKKTGCVP